MVQFYALSVFINLVAGLYLASESTSQQGGAAAGESGVLARLRELFDEKGAKFSLGLAALIVGLFKILTLVLCKLLASLLVLCPLLCLD